MSILQGNAVVAQSGGPTAVINASACGVIQEALCHRDAIFNLYGAFRNAKVPIIGLVQGRAVGLGCALAALCDITIASDKARFSFPETAHKIMPTIAFSALVDRMPRKAATFMIYSAQEIDAQKALTYALVSDVVAHSQLDASVNRLVDHFKSMPLAAVRRRS